MEGIKIKSCLLYLFLIGILGCRDNPTESQAIEQYILPIPAMQESVRGEFIDTSVWNRFMEQTFEVRGRYIMSLES